MLLFAKLSRHFLTERNYSSSYKIVSNYEARIVKYEFIKYINILWKVVWKPNVFYIASSPFVVEN